jgi:proline iminopeptidase
VQEPRVARRDELQQRDRTWAEEVEWRTLCWLPDVTDPAHAAALAATPLALNLECNQVLNAETNAWAGGEERRMCRRVAAPVLAAHGDADPRPVAGVEALVDALPDAELAVVPGAGHSPWLERPDAVARLLREFVRSRS